MNGRLFAPWETLLTALVVWVILLFSGRMVALSRSTNSPLQIFKSVARDGQHVVLVGDSDSCADVLRRLENSAEASTVHVLGVIETQAVHFGRAIRGVTIMGDLEDLGAVLDVLTERYDHVPWVAVTGKARQRETMFEILEIASGRNAKIMALGSEGAAQLLTPIEPAQLLARPERALDISRVAAVFRDQRVLVTGAGGTIGSELVRQVSDLGPESLTIVDCSEFNLYSIDHALRPLAERLNIHSCLTDVRDTVALGAAMTRSQPEVVLHAAALKHVPLMELNPCEAILTNVAGAINAARAAASVGAKRFVFISTDKAVDPDNVMGATKRLAEIAIARIAAESGMAASMVRFGNVLGSSGSVVPLFERQISEGGPVTVTDPSVTRFFMTVEEASALVLQAAALQDKPGAAELFVLDMGEPVQIQQLAETMIRLKGLVPGTDIKIISTGLREGEKMHEALTYDHEEVVDTEISGVMRVASDMPRGELFEKQLAALIEAAGRREPEEAIRLLGILVPDFGRNHAARRRLRSA